MRRGGCYWAKGEATPPRAIESHEGGIRNDSKMVTKVDEYIPKDQEMGEVLQPLSLDNVHEHFL